MTSNLKPLLKWAGGKSYLTEKLKTLYNPKLRLVEPFIGGLSVSLALNPKEALLNDINDSLINFYLQVQNGLKIDLELKNDPIYYYAYRNRFNQNIKDNEVYIKEQAELFYYLNRTCFNGLCRFNSKGEFNVPFGKYKTINYKYDFTDYKKVFKNWEFSNVDFAELDIKDTDGLYCDPPYDTEFSKYSKEDFKWEDQVRLIDWLEQFTNLIVISNRATDRIVELYTKAGYQIEYIEAPRRISCNGDRKPVREVLAYKNIGKRCS